MDIKLFSPEEEKTISAELPRAPLLPTPISPLPDTSPPRYKSEEEKTISAGLDLKIKSICVKVTKDEMKDKRKKEKENKF